MRTKERRLIVAFRTTHDAMAFEEYCIDRGLPGRLIPLPREISAGCGLAWSAPSGDTAGMSGHLKDAGIIAQQMQEMEI
jgi:hypothetical protein